MIAGFLIFFYNLIFCLVIGTNYFLLKEYKRVSQSWVRKNKIVPFFFILFFGSLLFIYEYFIALYVRTPLLILSITPIFLFVFLIYFQKKFTFLLFPFFLLGVFFNFYQNDYQLKSIFYILLMIIILFLFIQWMISISRIRYFDKKWKKFVFASYFYQFSSLIGLLFYDIVFSPIISDFFLYILLINFLFYGVFILITFFIFKKIDDLYINFFNLEKSLNKEEHSFYKISLWKKKLQELISKNQIKFGAIILIKISKKDEYKKVNLQNFLNHFQQLILKVYPYAFLFRTIDNYYSIFLPLQQEEINLKIIYQNNYEKNRNGDFLEPFFNILNIKSLNLSGYGSLYGIDSHNVDVLIRNARYLIFKNFDEQSEQKIWIYDHRREKDEFIEKFQATNYIKKYNDYRVSYILVIAPIKIYYCALNVIIDGKKRNFFDQKNGFKNKEKEYLERYFALLSLKNFDKKNFDYLIFNYPISYFISEKFDYAYFIKKIKINFAHDINKLLIAVDEEEFENKYDQKMLDCLINLKKNGLNYVIFNYENKMSKIEEKIPPLFKFKKRENILKNFLDLEI